MNTFLSKVSPIFILKFLALFVVLLPLQYLSFDIYSNYIRDNSNYFAAFDSIVFDIGDDFFSFTNYTAAREPILFFYFYFSKFLGLDYPQCILILNAIFSLTISFIVALNLTGKRLLLLISLYLATDYYLFVLFSELHRLKLALLFFVCLLSFKRKLLFMVLAVLSHFQAILLAYFYIDWKKISLRTILTIGFFLCVVGIVFNAHVTAKVTYYASSFSIEMLFKSYFLFLVLFTICFLFIPLSSNMNVDVRLLVFFVLMLIPISILGHERLNIYLVEAMMISVFFNRGVVYNNYLYFGFLFFLVLSFFLYNLYKISSQYQYLMEV